MKTPIEQFTESAKQVRLGSEAYARMRARLVAHMQLHPASVPSPYRRFFGILSPVASLLKRPVAALSFVALIALGGATTYAAASSLPGTPLYPVKVTVLEPAQQLLAVTPEAKAAVRVSIATKRIREVEELAVRQKLTPEAEMQSAEHFERSYAAAQATIEELAVRNPEAAEKVKRSLAVSLETHDAVLEVLSAASTTERSHKETRSFAGRVREKRADESGQGVSGPALMSAARVQEEGADDAESRGKKGSSKEVSDEVEKTLRELGL